ncbi:YigZ family protein [Nonomuraea dietziae]
MALPYLTLRTRAEHETEVKRSRFICAMAPAGSAEEAAEFIAERRRLHQGATHNCTAYVVGQRLQKGDDDGEPGGTAGTPMVAGPGRARLQRRGRGGDPLLRWGAAGRWWSGQGVRLGGDRDPRQGRARADGAARLVRVSVGHEQAGRVENDLRVSAYPVREVSYGGEVSFSVAVGENEVASFTEWVATLTAGRATVDLGAEIHVPES